MTFSFTQEYPLKWTSIKISWYQDFWMSLIWNTEYWIWMNIITERKSTWFFFLYNKPVISEEITGLMIMRLTFQVHPTHHHQPPTQNKEKKKHKNALNLPCISINYVHFVHQEHCTQSIQCLWRIKMLLLKGFTCSLHFYHQQYFYYLQTNKFSFSFRWNSKRITKKLK